MNKKSSLLIQEPPLQVLPSLVIATSLNEAIFLQQLHYWISNSKHERDGQRWVYNTYADWGKQMPWWNQRTIKRIVDSLRERGLIQTTNKYNKLAMDQTLWYSIDYDAVERLTTIVTNCHNACTEEAPIVTECHDQSDNLSLSHSDKLSLPITREYQETTTEKTVPPPPSLPAPTPTEDPFMMAAKAKFARGNRVEGWQAELNLRLAANLRVPLANAIGRVCGLSARMDTDDKKLSEVHNEACWFYEHGYKTPEQIDNLYQLYLADEWRRKNHPRPKLDAFVTFASGVMEEPAAVAVAPTPAYKLVREL